MITGAPAKLRERRAELTPMLSQYVDLAEEYDDAVLLFRVGDFYKAFCETAEEVARVCELTLIEREDSTGTYAACGIPIDNPATYLERLLDAGHRLAIADQVEDPEETTGLVERAVTRVVTPGTVVDDELLAAADSNYLACVVREGGVAAADDAADENTATDGATADDETDVSAQADDAATYGLAYVDVSTGECATTHGPRDAIREEVTRLAPAEFLPGPGVSARPAKTTVTRSDATTTTEPAANDRVAAYTEPDRFAAVERRALGGVLSYAEYTQGDDRLAHVNRVRRYDPQRSLRLDAAALRGLELFESREPSGRTLIGEIDETRSALGRRRLRAWLRRPLTDRDRIERRHDAVATLVEQSLVRAELREAFGAAYDLERLVGRVARGRADARDLRSLHATLAVVPEVREAITGIDALADVREALDPLVDVREEVDAAIVVDPPTEVTEGGVIREGYDDTLDELRATAREGREWVADLQARERERTEIDNLEVGYTQVHGYYIEVTNSHLDSVPDDYTRRQTLKNSERFYTPELKRREDEILGAEERAESREYAVFTEVRDRVAAATDRLQSLADALARLDALCGLAELAVDRNYCRPTMGADGVRVERGRHPVVERTETEFVPNDADLPRGSVTLLTGPNMSGKSTYMRQVALHVVLAQAGSFVPAASARLPVVDRVFTRVGASDDIAGGQSTFMREMAELTDILHDATNDSLVLLDEVGRGTSTADGRAIARAAVEYVHDETRATTIFATHYHELTALADRLRRVRNRHFAATREDGDVTFRHRVQPGAASSSYGIEVARMAGVPTPVVDRARELVADATDRPDGQRTLDDLVPAEYGHDTGDPETNATNGTRTNGAAHTSREADDTTDAERDQSDGGRESTDTSGVPPDANGVSAAAGDGRTDATAEPDEPTSAEATGAETVAADALDGETQAVLAELADVEVAETTPMEALQTLHDLQRRLGGDES